jgi:hypothetical protein
MMLEAVLLNPMSRRGRRRRSKVAGKGKGHMMARKKKSHRRRRHNPVGVARLQRRKSARLTRRRRVRGITFRTQRARSKLGWRRRRHGLKYWAKAHGTRRVHGHRRFVRNPFSMGNLIPSLTEITDAGIKGGGAVLSDVILATGYSLANIRPSQSLAEDAAGRIVAGIGVGALASWLISPSVGSKLREGTFTVAIYKLVSGVVGSIPGEVDAKGNKKLLGFLNNPFQAELVGATGAPKKVLPGLGDLFGVVPEGDIVPVGAVVPEGDVVPLGAMDVPARFGSRF